MLSIFLLIASILPFTATKQTWASVSQEQPVIQNHTLVLQVTNLLLDEDTIKPTGVGMSTQAFQAILSLLLDDNDEISNVYLPLVTR